MSTTLIGRTFGSRVVVKFLRIHKEQSVWLVRCVCTAEFSARRDRLVSGKLSNCGCQPKSNAFVDSRSMARTSRPEYKIWSGMKLRCSSDRFHRYHGRGIRVCDRWQSFDAFYEDMGPRPSPKHSIDRIDNDGHYEPGNCRWTTRDVQNTNKSSGWLTKHEVMGELYTVVELARITGVSADTIYGRLERGWTIERACSTPSTKRQDTPEDRYEMSEAAQEFNAETRRVRKKYFKGPYTKPA